MATLNPILTSTPGQPLTYNVGIAETFSWVPVEGAGRPLYARATYLANPEDIKVSLSAENINVNLDEIELNTDNVEELLESTHATLTAFKEETKNGIDQSISLLDSLTAYTDGLETLVQDNNTLLAVLTSSNDQIQAINSSAITLLTELTSSNVHVAGFSIPPYDEINLEYVGSTEYINKVSYLNNTTEVLALSFVYVTEPPTSSDNRILKVKKL